MYTIDNITQLFKVQQSFRGHEGDEGKFRDLGKARGKGSMVELILEVGYQNQVLTFFFVSIFN